MFEESSGVYHFAFDPQTGGITPVPFAASTPNAGGDPDLTSGAFSHQGIPYGVDQVAGIHAFTIDPTGVFAALPSSPFPTNGPGVALAMTP